MLTSTDPWDYVDHAIDYLCDTLAVELTDAQVHTLVYDRVYREAQKAMDAAAMNGGNDWMPTALGAPICRACGGLWPYGEGDAPC